MRDLFAGCALAEFERAAFANGFTRVAGVDEAGRGPLAGPLVAAAVVLRKPLDGLNDSKLLTEPKRDSLYMQLYEGGHAIGVGIIEPRELDVLGLQNANYAAMLRAVEALEPAPGFLMVDGFAIKGCAIPQQRIVKGDRRSISIAAASIIAKVTRDGIMVELDERYPEYGFAQHKGYATREHLLALERLGPCPIHRKTFAPISGRALSGELFGDNPTGN